MSRTKRTAIKRNKASMMRQPKTTNCHRMEQQGIEAMREAGYTERTRQRLRSRSGNTLPSAWEDNPIGADRERVNTEPFNLQAIAQRSTPLDLEATLAQLRQ